jgi:hypothetical protein
MIVLLLAGILFMPGSMAQLPSFKGDVRSQGMANARVMLDNHWSGMNNPAGLAGISTTSFGIYYTNCFQVPELGMGAFSCGIPTKTGNFGISYITFGYSLFRQGQASLAYGKAFGKKFRAGIGLHYLMVLQPADYGNLYALIPSLGIQLLPLNGITMGIQVFNPARQQYIPSGYQDVPSGFGAGTGYKLGNEVLFCAEVEKIIKEKAKYYGGFEIILQKMVLMRFGISSGEFPEFSFGIGFQSRLLNIDLAVSRHPVLGFSPAIGLSYVMK